LISHKRRQVIIPLFRKFCKLFSFLFSNFCIVLSISSRRRYYRVPPAWRLDSTVISTVTITEYNFKYNHESFCERIYRTSVIFESLIISKDVYLPDHRDFLLRVSSFVRIDNTIDLSSTDTICAARIAQRETDTRFENKEII